MYVYWITVYFFIEKQTKLKMMFFKVFVFVVYIINHGIAQDEPACKTENTCDCCKGNPDGTRELLDICNNQQVTDGPYWRCTYGCKDGYYGERCFNKCPEYCTRCAREFGKPKILNDYQICYLCAEGYYNGSRITNCSTPCPANCAENQCHKTTGNCLQGCKNNWSGDKCDVCAIPWYGNNCDMQCPYYCKDKLCTSNGECTTGCADDNFTGSKCNQCVVGKYGDFCDNTCSVHCKDGTCDRLDGQCTDGCTGNFDGARCDICQPGYYGTKCDKWCYSCLNGMCDQTTGRCIDCVIGKFNEKCDKSCSTGCHDGGCSREDGTCTSCRAGLYGKTCNKTCPDNCLNSVCGQYGGICHDCNVGFYSRSCDFKCSSNCINDTCYQDSSDCTFGCRDGNTCNNESQTSSNTGVIVGGVIASFIFGVILTSVLCFIWRRREKKENKNDPAMHVNAMYDNDKVDPDGYEELPIPNP